MISSCDVRWTLIYVGGVLDCDAPILEALDHCTPWPTKRVLDNSEQLAWFQADFLRTVRSVKHSTKSILYEMAALSSIHSNTRQCPVVRYSRTNVLSPRIEVMASDWQCTVAVINKENQMTLHLWLCDHDYKAKLQKAAAEFYRLEEG